MEIFKANVFIWFYFYLFLQELLFEYGWEGSASQSSQTEDKTRERYHKLLFITFIFMLCLHFLDDLWYMYVKLWFVF